MSRLAKSSGRPALSTGGGDRGFTYDPITRSWVPKWHPCIEFAGALDEAEASVAYARTLLERSGLTRLSEILQRIEELLFRVGFTATGRQCISSDDISWVEGVEAELSRTTIRFLDSFRLNGSTLEAAAVAVARTAVRRAERLYWRCVRLKGGLEGLTIEAGRLLNRLSDLLFLLQLEVDRSLGKEPPRIKCR